jgi:putative DNA methylase
MRKKLIEVSIPLEAINAASAREKSIRHGHPSTLHLWWARRPLAACRAVLFAQLVDDPSAWPERFDGEEEQEAERKRLHAIITELVKWENSNNETVLNRARWEIARSVAWGLGEEPPVREDGAAILAYLQAKAPPVYDPFCGGGSIPLEAQRLGLRAYGSDLNPVAVLISKALVEIPPKFGGRPPVHPGHDVHKRYRGAQGLAEDVRFYGQWMRNVAERRIGHLYPKAVLPDGSEATVIAWLWARTVRSPDPRAKGAMVPLVSSFMLSMKEGKKAWVEPVIDPNAPDGWRFEVRTGTLSKAEEERLKKGTIGRSQGGTCVLTGASMPFSYVRTEGQTHGLGTRLMAIVAEGRRSRVYLTSDERHVEIAECAVPAAEPEGDLPNNPRDFKTPNYGLKSFASLFTPRQLVALTTFSDLVGEVRKKVLEDACAAGLPDHPTPLHENGTGAAGYADAIVTYLAMAVDKAADYWSTICFWHSGSAHQKIVNTFARQAIPMTWDFAEGNPFSLSSGHFYRFVSLICEVLDFLPKSPGYGMITQASALVGCLPATGAFSSDPPYYDNIGYADLSDFFYIWLKRTLSHIWPDLFRRLATPKQEELVASPYRHGGREQAEDFFMQGMGKALTAIQEAAMQGEPLAIYYAFKQSEIGVDGITSAGWASFLQAVLDAGLVIDGTWPVRTELVTALKAGANALASSIVLVCRKRPASAPIVTRADFLRTLKREMPNAVEKIRKASVGPVDMPQSVIGPGWVSSPATLGFWRTTIRQ